MVTTFPFCTWKYQICHDQTSSRSLAGVIWSRSIHTSCDMWRMSQVSWLWDIGFLDLQWEYRKKTKSPTEEQYLWSSQWILIDWGNRRNYTTARRWWWHSGWIWPSAETWEVQMSWEPLRQKDTQSELDAAWVFHTQPVSILYLTYGSKEFPDSDECKNSSGEEKISQDTSKDSANIATNTWQWRQDPTLRTIDKVNVCVLTTQHHADWLLKGCWHLWLLYIQIISCTCFF